MNPAAQAGGKVATNAAYQSSTLALRGLLDILGIPAFRPDQLEAIVACAVQRFDLWLQLHCSAGKTLVFIAILLLHCQGDQGAIGILESPMQTSVAGTSDELRKFGIHVVELTAASRKDIVKLLRAGRPAYPTVIIGTPKQLKHKEFLAALGPAPTDLPNILDWKALPVSPVVVFGVDEAHCIQSWSHAFLHSFSKMYRLVQEFEKWPCGRTTLLIAMTATGTEHARPWIMKNLRFDPHNTKLIVRSPRRLNAKWTFRMATNIKGQTSTAKGSVVVKQISKFVLEEGHSVVVFVASRKKAVALAATLNGHLNTTASEMGITEWTGKVEYYHSLVPDRQQKMLREQFGVTAKNAFLGRQSGNLLRSGVYVMICTIAFGMSISIPYFDRILILEQPSTFEDLVQEGLRAGRADTPCEIYVYLSWSVYVMHVKHARKNGAVAQEIDRQRQDRTQLGQRDHRAQERIERLENAAHQEECATSVMHFGFDNVRCRNTEIEKIFDVEENIEDENENENENEKVEETKEAEEQRGQCAARGSCNWCDNCLKISVNHTPSLECQKEVVRYFQTFQDSYGVALEDVARAVWQRRNNQLTQGKYATCIRYFILAGVLKEGTCTAVEWGVSRGPNYAHARIQAMLVQVVHPVENKVPEEMAVPGAPSLHVPHALPPPGPPPRVDSVDSDELEADATMLGM